VGLGVIAHARAVHDLQAADWQLPRVGGIALSRLYQDGMFALKLAGSACIGAAVTLAILNNLDSDPGLAGFHPERYATGFHRPEMVSKDGSSLLEVAEPGRPLPANFPRMVKTLRFYDTRTQGGPSVAALNSGRVSIDFKANGTWLEDMHRPDGSLRLRIPLRGSLQNPAWSPDGKLLAFTRFRNGYNKGPADVYVLNLETNALQPVATDGSENVSQPGSTWTRDGQIVFSSDRGGHDEVWMARADGSRPHKITSRSSRVAYEPSLSPDARSVVFESHAQGEEGRGRIVLLEMSENRYTDLTPSDEDCRQPNWSPRGDYVVYQKNVRGRWDLWLFDMRTKQHRQATTSGGSTDATFSPDGRFLLYSGETGAEFASLLAQPVEGGHRVPITRGGGYQGAASWSPDGAYVAMEASARAPDGSATELIITPVRKELTRLSSGSP
jgi:TolB protein